MQILFSKMVAVAIASTYVVAAFALEKSLPFALTVAIGMLLPLSLIWFPEFLGGLTGWGTGGVPVDQPSPPKLVVVMGWLFLLGLPVVILFFADNHQ